MMKIYILYFEMIVHSDNNVNGRHLWWRWCDADCGNWQCGFYDVCTMVTWTLRSNYLSKFNLIPTNKWHCCSTNVVSLEQNKMYINGRTDRLGMCWVHILIDISGKLWKKTYQNILLPSYSSITVLCLLYGMDS